METHVLVVIKNASIQLAAINVFAYQVILEQTVKQVSLFFFIIYNSLV